MSNSPIACREIFDENSLPSQDEITDYAHHIGIDPVSESHLLPLAKDGLMQALPPPWKAYLDEKLKTNYYHNTETGVTQWEHPLDNVYRKLVAKARTSSEKDNSIHTDTCASVQELLTYEENSKHTGKVESKLEDDGLLTDSDESKSARVKPEIPKKPPIRPSNFASLHKPFNPLGKNDKKINDLRNSPLRRSIDGAFIGKVNLNVKALETNLARTDKNNMALFDKPQLFQKNSEIIDLSMRLGGSQTEDGLSLMPSRQEKGLSLSGKGLMFLKARPSSGLPSPDTEKSLPFDNSTKSEPPKGILREKTFEIIERKVEKNAEVKLDDDRKSVRFNLEQKQAEQLHEFSLSPSSNSSSDQHDKDSIVSNLGTSPFDSVTKINNETLTDLPPRPGRNLKLAPLVKNEGKKEFPKEPPLRPKTWTKPFSQDLEEKQESPTQASADHSESKRDANSTPQAKRLLKPPAGDFIKPNLFQKQFDKISDIIKPISLDTDSDSEVKPRPRSPLIPQKNKISINLMESIESETSIDSPDKEFANIDLNDVSDPIELKEKLKPTVKIAEVKVLSPKLNSPIIRINEEKSLRIKQLQESLESDLKTLSCDFEGKKKEAENNMRKDMEQYLKSMKEEINKEQQIEIDKLKEILRKQHVENKAEIEKAIVNSQEQHKLSLQHVMDNIQLKLQAEREEAVQKQIEKHKEELRGIMEQIEREHNNNVSRLRADNAEELSKMRTKLELENGRAIREMRENLTATLEIERARMLADNKTVIEKLRSDHGATCDELRKDYRSEVDLLRSQHSCHLAELRSRLAGEREAGARRRAADGEDRRLLEDKYRCLKEKYARLKTDVKMSIERRSKRREQSMTTGSETEKSNSNKTAHILDKCKDTNESVVTSSKSEPPDVRTNVIINARGEGNSVDNNNEVKGRSKTHLTVSRNGNSDLSENSRSKSPQIIDKTPMGKLMRENEKYSTDNEMSYVNDTSLSQSEHTVPKGKNKLTVAFSDDRKIKYSPPQLNDKGATDYHDSSDTANSEKMMLKESVHGRSRKKAFTRLKSASTSRLNYSPKRGYRSCSPVENLRQQLRKLEDLEEQFPDLGLNVDSSGYRMRYPFADLGVVGQGMPELEFVAHRALVEREGVRRARASLRRRRAALRDRRRRLTGQHTEQAWQEERDITDLEVSLHRTRALLGEKVIRLRHIEKTLRQMSAASSDDMSPDKAERIEPRRRDKHEATMSDISSQSSGFSSTEAQSDTNIRKVMKREAGGAALYEQSSEIISSLENLNTEIRDIWQVLNIQQRQNVTKVIAPPNQIVYTDLNYPIMGVTQRANPMAGMSPVAMATGAPTNQQPPHIPTLADRLQTYRQMTNQRTVGAATVVTAAGTSVPGAVATSLVERTKDLRDWLRQQASL